MTTNSYFESSFNAQYADQVLFDELIIESIQSYGRDYYYLPRTLSNFDKFFGEDAQSEFKSAQQVEMYLETISGWEGDESFISKFGMEIRDEATLVVSRTRFKETIGAAFDLKYPREGDIVVFPDEIDHHLRAFEIAWVDDEPTFYQLGKLNTFRLKVKLFEYNGEEFSTGISDIDTYNRYTFSQKIDLKAGGTGTFEIGEVVKQGKNFAATVIMHNGTEIILSSNVDPNAEAYNPDILLPIIGLESGAEWYVDAIANDTEHVPISDNGVIADELKDLISNRESNPFSGI